MDVKISPGGYRFLPIDGPFSAGVAAEPRFEIVRAFPPRYTELAEGFRLVERTLAESDRPLTALCAMELRIPKPFARDAWERFNRDYVAQHERWGLRHDGHMPAARTNVAPEFDPPAEPSLHAFSYTVPATSGRTTFVVSGTPEPEGTRGGLSAYWGAIADIIEDRMTSLGVTWEDATETQFYGTRADHEVFSSDLSRFQQLVRPGLRWFLSRPPITSLRLEIDVRALARESWV